jgi:hypothetical protein
MKFFLENHSGDVNIDSGPAGFSIHSAPESIFTSRRNPYSHRSGTIIHMPRNPQVAASAVFLSVMGSMITIGVFIALTR